MSACVQTKRDSYMCKVKKKEEKAACGSNKDIILANHATILEYINKLHIQILLFDISTDFKPC